MHNTYISTLSLRCKGSICYSSNDYSSSLLNDRFDRHLLPLSSFSSSSTCCCCCCANSIYIVPVNPSILYGLRQSTLIQISPYRRSILGGLDRCFSRFPVCDIDQHCYYEKSYSIKERSVCGRKGKGGNRRYGSLISEGKAGKYRSCAVGDAEVILCLLTEEVGEEYVGGRERNERSSRKVHLEKGRNGGRSSNSGKKNNTGSGILESASKCKYESVAFKSREEDKRGKEDKREEEREFFLRGENHRARARKDGSSSSSYYSFSSSGEFENDSEVQVKHEELEEESLGGYKRDSKRYEEIIYDGEVAEEAERHGGYAQEHGVVLKKENTAGGSYAASSTAGYDLRKKSEKKLTEVSIEETSSRKESSQRNSEVHKSTYGKVSGSYNRNDRREDKLASVMKIGDGTGQQYSQRDDRTTGQSELRKYKQFTEMPEVHRSDVEAASSFQKQYSGREKNLTASVNLAQSSRREGYKTASRVTREGEYKRNSDQLAEVSEIQEIDIRGTSASQRQSGIRMKKCEEDSTMNTNLVDDTEEQHHQEGLWINGQMDSRRKSQHLTEISDFHDVDTENMLVSQGQSDTRMQKQEENSNLAFSSNPEAREQHSQMNPTAIRRMETRKTSQDMINISAAHCNDTGAVSNTQGVHEKIISQERYSTSVVKSLEETKEKRNLIDERLLRIGPRKEAQRPSQVSSFREGLSEKASSSRASSKSNFQSRLPQIGMDGGNKKSSEPIVTPQSSQLVARGQLRVEPTHLSVTQKVSSGSLRSGSSAIHASIQESSPALQQEIYGEPRRETHEGPLNIISHEDALGSADRLQKSSMHFVGEFIEKASQEISTSEILKQKKTYETKLVYDDEQHKQKGASVYGSGDSQSKEQDPRHSSRGSGAKGPSDEMWDVTAPSIQEHPEIKVPESTTTAGNAAVKRTGKSLWNIITDIVLLRWTSHSETHSSSLKSGGRSSPNQSTSSEAWFSGQEPDENKDANVKKEKRSMPQKLTSIEQLEKIPTQHQGGCSSTSSKDKRKHEGVDSLSSSSGVLETGFTSKDISSPSSEGTFGTNFEGTSSGTAVAESSYPLPAIRMRRSPVVGEVTESGKADASVSGIMMQIEQPVHSGLTEVSGTGSKDRELTRRKLQRNNQVIKDRFDEWEDAFTLETEQRKIDEMFMREALLEAKKAGDSWEVPVGAVLVQHGKIIARGCNLVEELRDSTAHAEMICIREASNILQTWRLSETTLYITLEPCPMCAGAILQARIDTVVWGAPNKLLGADGSWIRLFPDADEGQGSEPADKTAAPIHPFHPNIAIRRGVLASECADIMQQFFQLRRRKKETKSEPPTPPSCLPISNHSSKFFTKMHDAFHIMFCL